MVAKTRSKARSTAASTEFQASTKPPAPARKKLGARRASKPETSHKRAHHADADPEAPPESKLFTRLPLELFIEIASYLHPFNLILLSRVNKFFRGVLMSRSAAKVWRSSLGTVEGLPPCPEDLCEPKYVALLFVGECSTCGVITPRNIDLILHVRLCAKCVKKQVAHISNFEHPDIHLVSADIVSTNRGETRQDWCLYYEAKAVEAEYKLRLGGGQQEHDRWRTERLEYLQKRYREAVSLGQWAIGKELDGFKSARKAKIEARLLDLGWEPIDFQSEEPWRRRQWMSLVYNVKPLDDCVWKELLPRLLDHLEDTRRSRLKKEAYRREQARIAMLYEFITSLRAELKPLAQATLKLQSAEQTGSPTSTNTTQSDFWYPYVRRRKKVTLFHIIPLTNHTRFCPESTALIETDMSMEAFELAFPAKKVQLAQIIDERRRTLDLFLFEMLPNDIQPVDSQGTDYDLVAGVDEDAQSLDYLPLAMRKLLRADVIFKQRSNLYFYPSDFRYWCQYTNDTVYDTDSSLLAQALLHTLGRPNASYLEMNGLGRSFHCGRCNREPFYCTWKDMVLHYQRKASEWQTQSEQVARSARDGKTITLIFTHDTSRTDSDKPLVRLVNRWANPFGSGIGHRNQICQLCGSVGILGSHEDGYITDHFRDVHLIDTPVEGVHYQRANP